MTVAVEILTPVIVLETTTPDLVEIEADATITLQVIPSVNIFLAGGDDYFIGDSTGIVTLTKVPIQKTEIVNVGGAFQRRDVDYTIALGVIDFGQDMTGLAIWIHYLTM